MPDRMVWFRMDLHREAWRSVYLWIFCFVCDLFPLHLYFMVSWRSENGSGMAFYHLGSDAKWRCSFPLHQIYQKVALWHTDGMWNIWVLIFVYMERLFDCFYSYSCICWYNLRGLYMLKEIMSQYGWMYCVQGWVTHTSYIVSWPQLPDF